ncbi:hypothetical protein AArcS_1290 [Natranaeroarchaeum sulfidigenes]|uniref:Uncharacterized protein n=1 Tax=Natranaeroarchaeum sulfidigenes TaxID=2784880 RepID=A0A897MPM0_9EURY|nr:hypothetical protein AArcS_1290 [Natranaeroarchaeum sulfidigenes]
MDVVTILGLLATRATPDMVIRFVPVRVTVGTHEAIPLDAVAPVDPDGLVSVEGATAIGSQSSSY